MRRIRCAMAVSLDGFIAGPHGEADWITSDPEFDFPALWAQFDTLLMGRRTYAAAVARLGEAAMRGRKTVVVSRTLRGQDIPEVTIHSALDGYWIEALREQPGKDIWLMGGGQLLRAVLQQQLVSTLELSILPVLLGDGVPLLPSPAERTCLRLLEQKAYRSGMLTVTYEIVYRHTGIR